MPSMKDGPKGLKDFRVSDSEIAKFTKEVDNMVRTLKHLLQNVEITVESSDSSKQLLGIVQCLKSVKMN